MKHLALHRSNAEIRAGATLAAPKEGEIDRIIRAFNKYEVDNFSKCVESEGLNWWCIVRYSVAHSLCMEQGLYGHEEPAPVAMASKGRSFLRQSARLVRDIFAVTLAPGRRVDTIYISTRRIEPLSEDIKNNLNPCLVVGGAAVDPMHHTAVSKQSVDFFVRPAWRSIRLPKSVAREAERIDTEIRRIFGSMIDIRQIILSKYRQHRAARIAWLFILSRVKGTRRIVYVNDDTLHTLVHIARSRGIATREVQHGYMGRSHEAFSYPTLPAPLTTLPDEVVVTRDTGDIVYPVPIVSWKTHEAATESAIVPRDIDVLVGSSPRRVSETKAVVAVLAGKGLTVAVKLHPAQNEDGLDFDPQSSVEKVQIHVGRSDFKTLARRSKIYIPVSPGSTTGFEAAENGANVIIIDYNGRKLTEMLDSIVSANVSSIHELPDKIDALLK